MALTHRDGPLAFVDDIDEPRLSDDDRHHLSAVLRERDGTAMVVSDGRGRWRRAVLAVGSRRTGDGDAAGVRDLGPIEIDEPPTPSLTIGFALVKGDRPELVVQKLTELGIDRIVPFVSEHTVVRWDTDRSAKQHARYARIAREAAMQCRRVFLPVVEPIVPFADVVAAVAAGGDRVTLADADGVPLIGSGNASGVAAPTTVLIGPEGGWSPVERSAADAAIRVGSHILRAETAAIATATLLAALRDSGAFIA